eukprot:3224133-Alexandrium_andersonii.AAC.1
MESSSWHGETGLGRSVVGAPLGLGTQLAPRAVLSSKTKAGVVAAVRRLAGLGRRDQGSQFVRLGGGEESL